MARPPAKELTERELEIMHVFWNLRRSHRRRCPRTTRRGRLDLAYTTVATLVRILLDKGFLAQQPGDRPFRYRPARSYEEVSRRLLGDLVERVFSGSREQLLVRLLDRKKLTAKERAALEAILKEQQTMNSLGAGLVWSGVQVSLLVLAGGLVYAWLRRRGPAAGSVVALALLVIAIALPILSLAAWPNWWRLPFAEVSAANHAAINAESADASTAAPETENSDGEPRRIVGQSRRRCSQIARRRDLGARVLEKLLGRPRRSPDRRIRYPCIAGRRSWLGCCWRAWPWDSRGWRWALAAVRAYRKRTQLVTDRELLRILDAIRVRIGCDRRIALRESAEIAAPATIGWRRPVILLPPQWREWSEGERRVVLAHEVAHVVRGDFAGWLFAQFSVVLHFYNPLVHWLARRLRIEQELAADAWGATAAGGSGTYLTTLASMALRQDDRAANWAARPFLPARGTLLRRIEMLRDRKLPQTFSFSWPKQIALWSLLAMLGLFIAGLRVPGTSLATADAAPPLAFVPESPAAAASQPIDLAYVPADSRWWSRCARPTLPRPTPANCSCKRPIPNR